MRPRSESNIRAGWFAGTCTNTTAGITANLLLKIHGATDRRMHGELGLYGNLGGSGPFYASLDHGRVRFTTCMPAYQVVIEWSGDLTENGFAGTYVTECDAPDLGQGGTGPQAGVWTCLFVRGLDDPDLARNHQVSVIHEGESAGPFTQEEFLQHALVGRWPPHALAAMQDCTVWGTVGECIASHQAGSAGSN
jgi:hypothetical protein